MTRCFPQMVVTVWKCYPAPECLVQQLNHLCTRVDLFRNSWTPGKIAMWKGTTANPKKDTRCFSPHEVNLGTSWHVHVLNVFTYTSLFFMSVIFQVFPRKQPLSLYQHHTQHRSSSQQHTSGATWTRQWQQHPTQALMGPQPSTSASALIQGALYRRTRRAGWCTY